MIVKLNITKDNKIQDNYKTLLRCKVIKELNCKELYYLFW